jgi:hypothetical protein
MLASFSGLYTFHPLGVDTPLFNWPLYIAEIDQRAASLHMPLALSRAQFAADLEGYEAQFGHWPEEMRPTNSRYYGPERGLNVAVWPPDGSRLEPASIPPSRVLSVDLSGWDKARADRVCKQYPYKQVAIDVQLGRLAFLPSLIYPETKPPIDDEDIRVTYCYGFSTSMGGGPYHRRLLRLRPPGPPFQIDVATGTTGRKDDQKNRPKCVPSLDEALQEWDDRCERRGAGARGVIRILDNGVYDATREISLPRGANLSIVADNGVRPVVRWCGGLAVACADKDSENKDAEAGRQLYLSGLLIHGGLQIGSEEHKRAAGGLIVTLEHCTLVTSKDRRLVPAGIEVRLTGEHARGLKLSIECSIVGPLYLPETTESLRVRHSIVGNGSGYAIAADPRGAKPGPTVNLERATVFGRVYARQVSACDVIFGGPLNAPAPESAGQIRHSYLPQGSMTPEGRPHLSISTGIKPPRFTSTRYGDPGYAQLSLDCPREIRGGAADGSEMGAFHGLHQLQAEENLRAVLEEYLPAGLNASIHYVT